MGADGFLTAKAFDGGQSPAAAPTFAEIQAVQADYFRIFGHYPRLRHPRTFTEKIAWRKLYQRDPRFTLFSDKYAVKQEVERLAGRRHVTPTLWAGAPEALPLDRLTPPYVIKVTHSCGGNIFVRRGAVVDRPKLVAFLRGHLAFSHGAQWGEWGYLDIPRQVLVEPMIVMPDGGIPDDYKFFVYHGRVHFIQVDYDRSTGHRRQMYDRDWRALPFDYNYPRPARPADRPARLEEMVGLAESIGAGFDFVRIDLYAPPAGLLFGEATFYPGAGLKPFTPVFWDRHFGAPWRLDSAWPIMPAPTPQPGALSAPENAMSS